MDESTRKEIEEAERQKFIEDWILKNKMKGKNAKKKKKKIN